MDDSKLKFLPRHLQRTQPAGTHKSKRRVTLESEDTGDDENDRRKPSVFERLGPGASQRTTAENVDDLRLKFKGQSGKDRESKLRSQVVVRKSGGGGDSDNDSGEDSDNWSIDKLASKKEMELERKRLEIQRALNALEANEEVDDHKKHTESSESSSSPERPAKKKKEKASKKEKRKKHKKTAVEKEKTKDMKRKMDSDEEDSSQKNQKKRKKKKQKHMEEVQRETPVVSKAGSKLLSPLKKVLKQKKGSAEPVVTSKRSSKRRRSESTEKGQSKRRDRSAGSDSSSDSSRSPSPVKRKKILAPESSYSRERAAKKRSRSAEKKRHSGRRDRRSASSPSSSSSSSRSSSSSSAPSRSRSRAVRARKPELQKANQTRSESQSHGRKDRRGADKKKRDKSEESWTGGKDTNADRSKRRQGGASSSSQPDKTARGRNDRRDQQYGAQTQSTSGKAGNKRGGREVSAGRAGGNRNDGKGGKDSGVTGNIRRGGQHVDWEKDGSGNNNNNRRDNSKRRGDAGRFREEEKGPGGRRDEKKPGGGSNNNNRDGRDGRGRDSSERKESSERQERGMRRGAVFGSGHTFSQQSSQHGGQRVTDGDRENRHYDEGNGRYGQEAPRMSQYQADRQRAGEGFDRRDRDGSDSRNDNRGPGRFNRGNDNGDGRGWDDRRHGNDGGMPRDEWSGRGERLGFGDDAGREFGRRREERRGGREERLLPHLGDNEQSKDSRFPQQMGEGGRAQRGTGMGHRGEEFGRERPGGTRDWKMREEGSFELSSRRDTGGESDDRKQSDSSNSRDRPRNTAGNQRSAETNNSTTSRNDRFNDKEADKIKRDVSAKISSPSLLNLKSQPTKEDSPATRDEPSLASLFSQTETVAPSKKKTTKSFGGKKSPKKSEEAKTDKAKPGLASRLGARSKRQVDKKPTVASAKSSESKPSDSDKSDSKAKEKVAKAGSPKDSHKSEDSPRSRQSQSRSRRSSKSPDSKRAPTANTTTPTTGPSANTSRSPVPTSRQEARQSRSPAPTSTRDKDKGQRSPANSSSRDRRRRDEPKRSGEQHNNKSQQQQPQQTSDRSKKRDRSRSHSSEEESHHRDDHKKRRRSSDSDSMPAKLEGGDIAAAMLGDGIDDGQQEEKVFSDWSDDDDAINILMGGDSRKPHLHPHAPPRSLMESVRSHHRRPIPSLTHGHGHHYGDMKDMRLDTETRMDPLKDRPALEKNIPNVKIVEDIQKEKPARERRRRDTDNEGYEEISSDENDLDEEGEKVNKRTIVSILDIDLSILAPSAKPKPLAGPVFMRYKAANVFAQLGISRRFAGDQLFKEAQETCRKQLEQMAAEHGPQLGDDQQAKSSSRVMVKEELNVLNVLTPDGQAIKDEPITEPILSSPGTPLGLSDTDRQGQQKSANTSESHEEKNVKVEKTESQQPMFDLFSDTCAIHRLLKSRVKEREGLFNNSTMLSRALTARRDLDIRRRLCKIPHNYDQSAIYPSGVADHSLHQMCSQLFKQDPPLPLPINVTASC